VQEFCRTRPEHGECTNENFEDLIWYIDMLHSQPPQAVPVPPRYRQTVKSDPMSPITSLALEPLLPGPGDLELWEKYEAKKGTHVSSIADGVRRSDRLLLAFADWRHARASFRQQTRHHF